ncbi:MAG: hypothetical protein GY909_07285 [Oligoflexia bacterium]|nr:hypothetical protein [Oligoflexia bacterium]
MSLKLLKYFWVSLPLFVLCLSQSYAGPREQAYRIHNRLTGAPPSPQILQQMENLISAGQLDAAIAIAIEDPKFYNVTLKNWAKKWTNVDQTNRVPLNDFVATIIGGVRDDLPFTQLLTENILYTSNTTDTNVDAYSNENNDHYEDLERRNINLAATLVRQSQSALTGIAATSGVVTSRASAEAFFSAGTNRRVNRFLFMNFLCKDYENLHDITIADVYVRRDVDRRPGGDSRTFKNSCVGCHAGQDAIAGAWSYYDWDGDKLVYTQGVVAPKINANNVFSEGNVTTNDNWHNLWASGQNANLGWSGAQTGAGGRSLVMNLTRTQAFSSCMASQAYQWVCLNKPQAEVADRVEAIAREFETVDNYNLKRLLTKVMSECVGE